MRVTPSTPSPRGSISTTSHYSSQAQTPIQGMAQVEPVGAGGGVGGGGGALDMVLLLQSKGSLGGHSLHGLVS